MNATNIFKKSLQLVFIEFVNVETFQSVRSLFLLWRFIRIRPTVSVQIFSDVSQKKSFHASHKKFLIYK